MLEITSEQLQFEEALDKAIQRTSPLQKVQALDTAKTFDSGLHRTIAEQGALGLNIPEADGGTGGNNIDQLLVLRLLGQRATSMAMFGVVHFLVTRILRDNANAAQKQEFLRPLASGRLNASFCLTEAEGGTDILRCMKTVARRDGGDFVINGGKKWISGATTADFHIVIARTSPGKTDGVSTFIVPKDANGITTRNIDTFAVNSYDTCEMSFVDTRIPARMLVGEEGKGFRQVIATLNTERLNASAVALGMARGAIEAAAEYARGRQAFGKTLSELQAVQHKLANAATSVELAWSFLIQTAGKDIAGEMIDVASAMTKLASSNAAKQATDIGMEIMGATGFDVQSPMQRYYRDHRLYSFAPLNDEMCRNLIAERHFHFGRSF